MKNDSISILKAFGIIFMVVGHAGCPTYIHDFIYMFHMPLFFIASGYCFKMKYLGDNKTFILRRIKGLYLPFVKYSLIFLVLHNVFFKLNIYNGYYGFRGEVSYLYTWADFVKDTVHIVTRMTDNAQLLGGYWFLREMFFGTIMSLFLMKYVHSVKWCLVLMLGLSVILDYFSLHIPYLGIGSLTCFSAAFFISGHMAHKYFVCWKVKGYIKRNISLLFVLIVGLGSVLMPTNMLTYSSWQILPYFVCALAGTCLFFNISTSIANSSSRCKEFLLYIGENTIVILTYHFLCFKLVSLVIIGIYKLPIESLAEFPVISGDYPLYWLLYSIVGVVVPIGAKYYIFDKMINCSK